MEFRGLLILSEDGVLAKAIIGPESELDKEYLVEVRGTITPRSSACCATVCNWTGANCDRPRWMWSLTRPCVSS